MRKKQRLALRAAGVALILLVKGYATAGSPDSTNDPAPTMHTLEEGD